MFVGVFLRHGMMVEIDMKTKEKRKKGKLAFFFPGWFWMESCKSLRYGM